MTKDLLTRYAPLLREFKDTSFERAERGKLERFLADNAMNSKVLDGLVADYEGRVERGERMCRDDHLVIYIVSFKHKGTFRASSEETAFLAWHNEMYGRVREADLRKKHPYLFKDKKTPIT